MREIEADRYYVASDSGLREAASIWQQYPALGIDTEFIRVDTFYPRPALIQVSNGQQCWLIDVLDIHDFSPLVDIITAPHIVKIVHAASEDMDVFDRLLGTLPEPLFDTQIGAAFCGHGASIGYGKLVQTVLDIELSKDQCRSDWLARPLTDEQQHYACLDVLYLPALYSHLQIELDRQQRTEWAQEENLRQITRYRDQRGASYNMERVNNAWRLDETERKRLWNLVLGRDALAREYDKPRNHIAKDFALFEMARRPPRHIAELTKMEGLRSSGIRQFGNHLMQLAHDVPQNLVYPPLADPLSKTETEHLKKLRAVAEQIANAHHLPPELLVRKLEMEQLVRQYFLRSSATGIIMPERFNGWRQQVISQALHDEMATWN
ncbi:MAG TPA: ribonuclease D [Pseudomonadales bacterium]|nr:ribonuclease D [Pseudomonadales bacterium]